MAVHTKKIIMQNFVEILKTKPLNKITVTDIVEKCEISRKTFYYHYADIYDLAENYYRESLQAVIEKYPSTGLQWIDGMKEALHFFQDNKAITLNLINSIDYYSLECIFFNAIIDYSRSYIERKSQGINISETDKANISEFLTNGITSTVLKWVKTGMNGNPDEVIDYYVSLFGGGLNYIVSFFDQ